jgi:PAS domain S-box-containing protein
MRLGGAPTLAIAAALFLGVFLLRLADSNMGDGETLLYMIPVGILALGFGLRGGIAGAAVGFALTVAWVQVNQVALTDVGFLTRGLAYLAVGALIGAFVDQRHRLEAELLRYFEQSLDLLWTADLGGQLIRVNPAWQRLLGWPAETMSHHALSDFIHPSERPAATAEIRAMAGGESEKVGMRSRYETVDGRYVWLEWSAHASPSEGLIHGSAHDITAQRTAERQLTGEAKKLETRVAERTRDLNEARAETLQLLAVAGEYRDDETSRHTERVGTLSGEIGARLGLSEESVTLLREAAPLHDIGKLAISDSVLLKPGRLTPAEQKAMHQHATLGARLLYGSRSPALQLAGVIAESHHEWWDGSGYPQGLVGANIPLVGRIVAVADVFDALTHDRPYKPAWPIEQAITMIRRSAGSQFDPRVVNAFLAIARRVTAVPARDVEEEAMPVAAPARVPHHQAHTRREAGAPAALPNTR